MSSDHRSDLSARYSRTDGLEVPAPSSSEAPSSNAKIYNVRQIGARGSSLLLTGLMLLG